MGKLQDLTFETYGRLWVLRDVGKNRQGYRLWCCLCACGNKTVVKSSHLTRGASRSCGCLRSELSSKRQTDYLTGRTGANHPGHRHGHTWKGGESRTYRSWKSMLSRCTNPKDPRWSGYGGRGIEVCENWHTFAAFLADMGERPADRSIDRIDNNGNYEPGNCRWATASEQQRNKGSDPTSCKRGHPFDDANTHWYRGKRSCRTCCRDAARRRYHARKVATPG